MSHNNPGVSPLHEYYIVGRVVNGCREYAYMMTAHMPKPDSYISDLSMAIKYDSLQDIEDSKSHYPSLKTLTIWKVGVLE